MLRKVRVNQFWHALNTTFKLIKHYLIDKLLFAVQLCLTVCSRSVIAAAMQEYATKTCVHWVPRNADDYDYIYIVPDRGCYSMVGKTGDKKY